MHCVPVLFDDCSHGDTPNPKPTLQPLPVWEACQSHTHGGAENTRQHFPELPPLSSDGFCIQPGLSSVCVCVDRGSGALSKCGVCTKATLRDPPPLVPPSLPPSLLY